MRFGVQDLADITPGELRAATVGIGKQRGWWYELGLFVAWHVAAFNTQAEAGKLKDWSEVRRTVGKSEGTKAPVPWQATKAEREQQMALMKKHHAQRHKAPVKRAKNHV